MSLSRVLRAVVTASTCLVALSGCDKLKSMAGRSDADGGAATSSGGGLLSFGSGDFEGEITMSATSKGNATPTTMVFSIKKPKVRIDAKGGIPTTGGGIGMGAAQGAVLIIDPTQKKGWALSPADKRAIVFDFEKMKTMPQMPGMPGMPGAAKAKGAPPKIDKTGKKDTVAGYACEIWVITQQDGKRADVCAAEGITWVDVSDLGWSSPEMAAATALTDANRFPLRIVSMDATGAVDTKVEATKIEKKQIDDAQLVVPPDYQQIDIAAMMQGLKALGAGGVTAPTPKTR